MSLNNYCICNLFISIPPARLVELADLISKAFSTEEKETYYIRHEKSSAKNQKDPAKGKLHDKNGFFRRLLIKANISESRKGKKRAYVEEKEGSRIICLGYREQFAKKNVNI